MKKIAVIGSINMDMTVETDRIPRKGETVPGKTIHYIPGGKGANQAVAAARLGGDVTFFGCVGTDAFGEQLLANLNREGIHTEHIARVSDCSSGLAVITVGENDNTIVVIPGANSAVTPAYLDTVKQEILKADLILLQNEIPQETIRRAIDLCAKAGKTVVYNPAPAYPMPREQMDKISYLTPNEHELAIVLSSSDPLEAQLLAYPEKLIVTLGSAGVCAAQNGQILTVPAHKATVVDTTGAGDTFNGAFAFALAEGYGFRDALCFANVAASLSTEKPGAQGGMPTWDEVTACGK